MPKKRPASSVSWLAGSLCLAASLAMACAYRWPPPREREYLAHTLDPERNPWATLPPPLLAVTRMMRAQVFADDAYRAQNPQWQRRIRALFARASLLTQQQFGARFELAPLREWPAAAPGRSLEEALAALASLPADPQAEWVVGLLGAPAPVAVDAAGLTHKTGRHIVLRAGPPGTQDDALPLLRQWGLSLAVPADAMESWVLGQAGQPGRRAFSTAAAHIILIGLHFHGNGSPEARRAWASVVRDAALHGDDADEPTWHAALEWAEHLLRGGQQPPRELPDGPEASTLQLL